MIRSLRHLPLLVAITATTSAQSFTISVEPESRIVTVGERAKFEIKVTPHDGYSASVFLRYYSIDFADSEISLDVAKINSPYTATATLSVTPQPGLARIRSIVIEGRNADLVVYDTVRVTVVVASGKDQWITYDTANSILPSNTIFDVAFDRNDIPWIGTKKGLVRLDPNGTTLFNKKNAPFGSESILAMAVDSTNGVWVSTFDDYAADIYCFRDGQWTAFTSGRIRSPHGSR